MALLTLEQIDRLKAIVASHCTALAVEIAGPDAVPHETLRQLVARGVLTEAAAAKLEGDAVGDAYRFGLLVARLAELGHDADGWSAAKMDDWLRRDPVPLGPAEKEALAYSRRSAGQRIQALGDTFAARFGGELLQASEQERKRRLSATREVVADAVTKRRSRQALASDLRNRLGELTRDVDRVASTELQDAHNEGTARWIARNHGDDALVSRVPGPGACKACLRLFLGPDGKPKVFRMADLTGHDGNRGVPRADWKPTIEAVHPWCKCSLVHVPEGWVVGADGMMEPAKPTPAAAAGMAEYRRRLAAREAEDAAATKRSRR